MRLVKASDGGVDGKRLVVMRKREGARVGEINKKQ